MVNTRNKQWIAYDALMTQLAYMTGDNLKLSKLCYIERRERERARLAAFLHYQGGNSHGQSTGKCDRLHWSRRSSGWCCCYVTNGSCVKTDRTSGRNQTRIDTLASVGIRGVSGFRCQTSIGVGTGDTSRNQPGVTDDWIVFEGANRAR